MNESPSDEALDRAMAVVLKEVDTGCRSAQSFSSPHFGFDRTLNYSESFSKEESAKRVKATYDALRSLKWEIEDHLASEGDPRGHEILIPILKALLEDMGQHESPR